MNEEFIQALTEIEKEKGIKKEVIFDALESALVSSYKKNFGSAQNVLVKIDRDIGTIEVFSVKTVVEEVEDENLEMTLEDAKKISPRYELGDVVNVKLMPKSFGRIAAQTAKQVVIQRIRDAERDVIFEDYTDRENEIITGQVQRISRGNVYVDLDKTEAILPTSEQIIGETYSHGDRYKMLLLEVKRTTKGPQIILSRSHPNLVKRLFELEVPEIHDGVVEIFSIAREAGSRTKIAVFTRDEDIDPLGACVGFKGSRVKAIVDELHDEKIDIVIYEKDIASFIANSLSPSKVEKVFVNEYEKSALVVVPDYQLSLAIGKEGQNARLAAKLTNWKIDIKSESQFAEYLEDEGIDEEELKERFGRRTEIEEPDFENESDFDEDSEFEETEEFNEESNDFEELDDKTYEVETEMNYDTDTSEEIDDEVEVLEETKEINSESFEESEEFVEIDEELDDEFDNDLDSIDDIDYSELEDLDDIDDFDDIDDEFLKGLEEFDEFDDEIQYYGD